MSIEKLFAELKPFSYYQIWLLIFIVGARSFINMITFMPILTTGKQSYVCADFADNASFTASDNNASCVVYAANTNSCSEWIFDQSQFVSTIRSQFSLICGQEYMAELSTTLYFIGCLLGDLFFGLTSDRWGRRKALIASSSVIFLFSFTSAFAPTFWMYCLTRMLAGVGDGGVLNVAFTLLSESTSSKLTVLFTFIFYQGWSIGILIMAFVGYYVRNHWHLSIILSIPQFLIPILCVTINESLRWLISKGHLDEADRVAKRIAKRNNVKLASDFTVKKYVSDVILMAWKEEGTKVPAIRVKDFFQYPRVLRVSLIVWFGWFVGAFGCYATSLGVSMLGWRLHLVLVLSSVVEIPARFYGLIIARRFGRIKSICSGYALSGALCLLSIAFLFNDDLKVYLIVSALIAKFFITQSSETLITYTVELFPTCMRNMGVSIGCACSRIAAMLAPLIVTLQHHWVSFPFLVLGILPIVTTAGLAFLPDTRGHPLIERIDQFDKFLMKKQKGLSWIWNKKMERSSSESSIDYSEEVHFDSSRKESSTSSEEEHPCAPLHKV